MKAIAVVSLCIMVTTVVIALVYVYRELNKIKRQEEEDRRERTTKDK